MKTITRAVALSMIVALSAAASVEAKTTEVEVNIYKLYGQAPFWHAGVVIDGREWFFDDTGKVKENKPGRFNKHHHRTITRTVKVDSRHVRSVFDDVKGRWANSRYDVSKHNCLFFVNDVLKALGSSQLDSEYLECSGIAKAFGQTPGAAFIVEAGKQAQQGKLDLKQLEVAYKEDQRRVESLPKDTVAEAKRLGGKVSAEAKRAGGNVSSEFKRGRKRLGL